MRMGRGCSCLVDPRCLPAWAKSTCSLPRNHAPFLAHPPGRHQTHESPCPLLCAPTSPEQQRSGQAVCRWRHPTKVALLTPQMVALLPCPATDSAARTLSSSQASCEVAGGRGLRSKSQETPANHTYHPANHTYHHRLSSALHSCSEACWGLSLLQPLPKRA